MSWLDKFFVGVAIIQSSGVILPQRPTLDFTTGLVATDDAVNNRTLVASVPVYPLVDPSVQGLSKFTPDTLAPASTAEVDTFIATGQTNAGAHTGVVIATIPLPGTVGAPNATGALEVDCEVTLMSTSTTDAARFKLTWQWSVQSPGSPVALGTLTTSLAVGSNSGAPPSGWVATIALDGGSDNALIKVTGDPTLTVTVKALVQRGYTQ